MAERDERAARARLLEKRYAHLEQEHARVCAAHDHHDIQVTGLKRLFDRLVSTTVGEMPAILTEIQHALGGLSREP
jgi:hypothetical protein